MSDIVFRRCQQHTYPYMNSFTIVVNPAMRGTPFIEALPSTRYSFGATSADFSSGPVSIVTETLSLVSTTHPSWKSMRATLEGRLAALGIVRSAAPSDAPLPTVNGRQVCALVVYCNIEEPDADVLTYINEVCLAKGAQLLLAWTPGEIAGYVLALTESVTSARNAMNRPKGSASMEAVLDCLATSKLMQKPDATRFADKFRTPAELFGATLSDLEQLPQFGVTKARKMHALLHLEFPTTRMRLEEMPTQLPATPAASLSTPTAMAARAALAGTRMEPPEPRRVRMEVGGPEAVGAPREPASLVRSGQRRTARPPPAGVAGALARQRDAEDFSQQQQAANAEAEATAGQLNQLLRSVRSAAVDDDDEDC